MIRKALLFAAAVSVAVFACRKNDSAPAPAAPKDALTGEQLFRAVMFGQGDYAAQLPSYKEMRQQFAALAPEQQAQFNARVEAMISDIKQEDAGFFNTFKNRIVSGNHREIQAAIAQGSYAIADRMEILVPGFSKLQPIIEQDVESGRLFTNNELDMRKVESRKAEYRNILRNNFITQGRDAEMAACTIGLACFVYFAAVVHHTAAVTAAVAVAIVAWKYIGIPQEPQSARTTGALPLQLEMMINDIALTQ